MRRDGTAAARPVIEHWINEQLENQGNLFPVSCSYRQGSGVPSSSTLAANCDPFAIDSQRIRVSVEPPESGVIIFELTGEARFWREAVPDGNHHAVAGLCGGLQEVDRESGAASDVAATVTMEKCGPSFFAGRRINDLQL
jgi:hypothetical protein